MVPVFVVGLAPNPSLALASPDSADPSSPF